MTKEIMLNSSKVTLVDDADFDWLNQYKWSSISQHRYVARAVYDRETHRPTTIYMHRQIMTPPAGMTVDHIDRDGFNNQRSNLRIASLSENLRNRPGYGASKYRGVGRSSGKNAHSWIATFTCGELRIRIGVFYSEIDAARAYDAYAVVYGDQFTLRNLPHETALTIDEATQLRLGQHRINPSKARMTSQYRGVSFYPSRGYWRMGFRANASTVIQKYFKTEIDAARAYDAAARQYHGEFARLNFPNEATS